MKINSLIISIGTVCGFLLSCTEQPPGEKDLIAGASVTLADAVPLKVTVHALHAKLITPPPATAEWGTPIQAFMEPKIAVLALVDRALEPVNPGKNAEAAQPAFPNPRPQPPTAALIAPVVAASTTIVAAITW